jgi:hypothetical protein
MRSRRLITIGLVVAIALGCRTTSTRTAGPALITANQAPAAAPVALPVREGSLKFGVLGDFGTGSRQQYELGSQMAIVRARFPFELIITTGDNLYGSQRPGDFKRKFEDPYKALIDGGVKFYASLGNHDEREPQRYYQLFNMGGELYYSFKAPQEDVRFFALDTTQLNPAQLAWLEQELRSSGENWKIAYFHHPLYSSGRRHGSDEDFRKVLEPLFIKYNVSVVFAGHDHFYERLKPQNGIAYFVVGSGGQLRRGNIDVRTGLTAKGFDTDQAFLAVEIDGDEMFFNAISRAGQIVDSGVIQRRQEQPPAQRGP